MGAKSFPNTKQEVGTAACGTTSLVNIYTYFNQPLSLTEIRQELDITDNDTTYLPQLAKNLLEHKFKTILLTSNTYSIAPEWAGSKKVKIISELKKWLTKNSNNGWLLNALHTLFYLEDGGDIKITDLSTKVLDNYLDKGYVLLTVLEESWLWGKRKIPLTALYHSAKGKPDGHVVVIYSKKGVNYYISDPYPTGLPNKEGLYAVSKDRLLVSCLLWGGQVLAVKK